MIIDKKIMLHRAIARFIRDNGIQLDGKGVVLNRNLIVLCGYIDCLLQKRPVHVSNIKRKLIANYRCSPELSNEFDKVMYHAKTHNYYKFWVKPEAGELYQYHNNII